MKRYVAWSLLALLVSTMVFAQPASAAMTYSAFTHKHTTFCLFPKTIKTKVVKTTKLSDFYSNYYRYANPQLVQCNTMGSFMEGESVRNEFSVSVDIKVPIKLLKDAVSLNLGYKHSYETIKLQGRSILGFGDYIAPYYRKAWHRARVMVEYSEYCKNGFFIKGYCKETILMIPFKDQTEDPEWFKFARSSNIKNLKKELPYASKYFFK